MAADPRFSHIVRSTQSTTENVISSTKTTTVSIKQALKHASSLADIQHIIRDGLVGKIASVSMAPRGEIEINKPLATYGMDSLVAVDIRNWIANEMAANITALEFIDRSSLAGLSDKVIEKSTLIHQSALVSSVTE